MQALADEGIRFSDDYPPELTVPCSSGLVLLGTTDCHVFIHTHLYVNKAGARGQKKIRLCSPLEGMESGPALLNPSPGGFLPPK